MASKPARLLTITTRLPVSTYNRLQVAARVHGLSLSRFVQEILVHADREDLFKTILKANIDARDARIHTEGAEGRG